jgi:type IV secretory pathway VirB6-like protein
MARELSEDTNLQVSLKTLLMIAAAIATAVGMYYSLMKEIEIAKELPEPNITRTEFDLKDQMIRDAVMQTQKDVQEIHKDVKIIDERLFEMQKKKR